MSSSRPSTRRTGDTGGDGFWTADPNIPPIVNAPLRPIALTRQIRRRQGPPGGARLADRRGASRILVQYDSGVDPPSSCRSSASPGPYSVPNLSARFAALLDGDDVRRGVTSRRWKSTSVWSRGSELGIGPIPGGSMTPEAPRAALLGLIEHSARLSVDRNGRQVRQLTARSASLPRSQIQPFSMSWFAMRCSYNTFLKVCRTRVGIEVMQRRVFASAGGRARGPQW